MLKHVRPHHSYAQSPAVAPSSHTAENCSRDGQGRPRQGYPRSHLSYTSRIPLLGHWPPCCPCLRILLSCSVHLNTLPCFPHDYKALTSFRSFPKAYSLLFKIATPCLSLSPLPCFIFPHSTSHILYHLTSAFFFLFFFLHLLPV